MENYKSLFLSESKSDVYILVNSFTDVWRIPAHSLILCQAGETLTRMVEAASVNENGYKELVIDDLKSSTVLTLICYIYTGKISINDWDNTLELLYAANKYQLHQLISTCERALFGFINVQNVCDIIISAGKFHLTSIEEKCLEIIKTYALLIFNSRSFFKLTRNILALLLSSDDLNVPNEEIIFRALWKWGKKECCRLGKTINEEQIGEVLGDLLNHIRVQHIKDIASLPLCLRLRHKPRPPIVTKKHDKKHEDHQEIIKERNFYSFDALNYSSTVCLMGPRSWENVWEMSGSNLLCALFSTTHIIYLTGFSLDLIERSALSNCLYMSVTEELSGLEVARQECRWIDSYDRKNQDLSELWHLSQTNLLQPVLLRPNTLYGLRLHAMGTNRDAFPCQTVKQNQMQQKEGIGFVLHASQLIAVRNLHFISLEADEIWN